MHGHAIYLQILIREICCIYLQYKTLITTLSVTVLLYLLCFSFVGKVRIPNYVRQVEMHLEPRDLLPDERPAPSGDDLHDAEGILYYQGLEQLRLSRVSCWTTLGCIFRSRFSFSLLQGASTILLKMCAPGVHNCNLFRLVSVYATQMIL